MTDAGHPRPKPSATPRGALTYGTAKPQASGARISAIKPNSPAAQAGLKTGEFVQSVNGTRPLDILDWLWGSDGSRVTLTVAPTADPADPKAREVVLTRSSDQTWGIEFDDLVFDGVRRCRNNCRFCFMKQLPGGLRPALTLRDDDYRLSFLQGNFVTLTNLDDEDVARIKAMNVSPLYVSFHAADPQVREQLIGAAHQSALARIDELAAGGIDMHIQIVLVPGVNDGAVLDDTLRWLSHPARRKHIPSVGIVPVAYTDYTKQADGQGQAPRSFTQKADAQAVIAQVQREQFKQREATGQTWVHLADEFYIYANAPFPLPEYYDGFPQFENGIGIVLDFVADVREHLDEFQAAVAALPAEAEAVTLVSGELARDTMVGALSAVHAGGRMRVLPVRNRFFGGNVTVTGLLTAGDIVAACAYDFEQLRAEASGPTTYVVPDAIFNADGVTLDDYSRPQLVAAARAAGFELCLYDTSVLGLISALRGLNEARAADTEGRAVL